MTFAHPYFLLGLLILPILAWLKGKRGRRPAFVSPEMATAPYVAPGWYPRFIDYFRLSFTTATAFSPTDVSAIKPWAKLMMMAEEAISLLVAVLVVSRAADENVPWSARATRRCSRAWPTRRSK